MSASVRSYKRIKKNFLVVRTTAYYIRVYIYIYYAVNYRACVCVCAVRIGRGGASQWPLTGSTLVSTVAVARALIHTYAVDTFRIGRNVAHGNRTYNIL